MRKKRVSRTTLALLLLILALALVLRVFGLGHTLSYDEAWNSVSMVDAATGNTADIFYGNFLRHPPLYSGIGVLVVWTTGAGRAGLAVTMELFSMFFALGLILTVFLFAREWFGNRAGLLAAFFIAIMPAARVYDVFIKQESLTLLLVMVFLLLFFRKRYFLAGISLGLAMLAKEIFVFAPVALFVFLVVKGGKRELKGFAVSAGTGIAVSAWWYLAFSTSTGEFLDFFLGKGPEAANWGQPWYRYLLDLPYDIGWVVVVLLVGAVILCFLRATRPGERSGRDGRFTGTEMAMFLVIWTAVVLFLISLAYGKPPWMVYSLLPPVAILAGWFVSEVYESLSFSTLGTVLICAVVALSLVLSAIVGFEGYMSGADPTYDRAVNHREAAEYINRASGGRSDTLMRYSDLSPVFAFYLDSYMPEGIILLDEPPPRGRAGAIKADHSIILMDRAVDSEEAADMVAAVEPEFVFLKKGPRGTDVGRDPASAFETLQEPERFGPYLVFDGVTLSDSLESVRR